MQKRARSGAASKVELAPPLETTEISSILVIRYQEVASSMEAALDLKRYASGIPISFL